MEILRYINRELRLQLEDSYQKTERVIDHSAGRVVRATRVAARNRTVRDGQSQRPHRGEAVFRHGAGFLAPVWYH
jgi:hypothetical protein